jgi:hypothetical protein
MTQEELISLAYEKFSGFKKPAHSTNFKCCWECEEYDDMLREVCRHELTIEQIGTVCWGPIAFLLPEAMAYYMPRIIEFAVLKVENKDRDPFITQFINQFSCGLNYDGCSLFGEDHIKVVGETFKYINENYREIVEDHIWEDLLDQALQNWWIQPQA